MPKDKKTFHNPTILNIPHQSLGGGVEAGNSPTYVESYLAQHQLLKTFPLIDDFEIRMDRKKSFEDIYFYSKAQGRLASLLDWGFSDITDDRLVGNQYDQRPLVANFDGIEQGWNILVFGRDKFVYVLQGPGNLHWSFDSWFKIGTDDYLAAWKKIIKKTKSKTAKKRKLRCL